jgi:hypothetical protein
VRKHFLVGGTAVLAVTSALLTLPLRAAGQSSTGAPNAQAKAQKTPEKSGTIKRLPDGTPDIRGTWTKVGGGLNEAKAPETELKAFGVLSEPQGFGQGQVTAGPGGQVAKRRAPKYAPNPRPPQGIVDPPDRVLPYTPEGRALRLDYAKNMCCPAKSFDYIELSMRCVPPQPWAGGGVHILQRPGEVVLLFESNHHSRVFYTDGRSHPSSNMRFFGGHSIGKWEGNTLVIDTTNLDGRAYFGVGNTFAPFSKELHLTERFTVVSDKLILFELTYDDPKTFTRPVKSAGYYYPSSDEDEELAPELTCHEGSYALLDAFGF